MPPPHYNIPAIIVFFCSAGKHFFQEQNPFVIILTIEEPLQRTTKEYGIVMKYTSIQINRFKTNKSVDRNSNVLLRKPVSTAMAERKVVATFMLIIAAFISGSETRGQPVTPDINVSCVPSWSTSIL
jgi:hypothetical protein